MDTRNAKEIKDILIKELKMGQRIHARAYEYQQLVRKLLSQLESDPLEFMINVKLSKTPRKKHKK